MVITKEYLSEQLGQFSNQRDEARTILNMTEAGIRLVEHLLWVLDQPQPEEEANESPNLEVVTSGDPT